MRLKNIPRARDVIAESAWVVHEPEACAGKWAEIFSNDHPIHVEIGAGKGRFVMEMAKLHPNINYIALEKYSSVLLRGVENQNELQLPNVRFIRGEAELITVYFAPGEIDRVYLNFSDPWPKKRNAKRRLPSRQFLQRYSTILTGTGTIEFKTDNRDLFDFAVEETEASDFFIREITYDLHRDTRMNEGNVMTEYEERFSRLGNKICKYILERRTEET